MTYAFATVVRPRAVVLSGLMEYDPTSAVKIGQLFELRTNRGAIPQKELCAHEIASSRFALV